MKTKLIVGSIIAVALLTLVSFSSVVGYSSVKNTQEEIITDEYDSYTQIQLVFQLISKLRNHKDIENVETENDVLQIIESDEELNSIVEQLSVEDCGCEDEETTEGEYPIIICLILLVIFAVALNSSPFPVGLLVLISYGIADKLNCPFVPQ